MEWAVRRKIELNGRKYREQDVKDGSCKKYTEYSANTGITVSKGQSTIDLLVSDAEISSVDNSSFHIAVAEIIDELRAFNRARGWERTHTPRNIILCLMGEIGELTEIFQWVPDKKMVMEKEKIDKASQEIADIVIYLLNLLTTCKINLEGLF
jgi:NTP pyrophosphatase (non-canonical NTP hydrolase)